MRIMPKNNFIKELRISRDLTQEDLAGRMNTTQETVQRLESGRRKLTYQWIRLLADALGVHPSEITEGPATAIPKNEEERTVLQAFRGLSDREQKMFSAMLTTFSSDMPALPDQAPTQIPNPQSDKKSKKMKK